jgi:hypothetical protein
MKVYEHRMTGLDLRRLLAPPQPPWWRRLWRKVRPGRKPLTLHHRLQNS